MRGYARGDTASAEEKGKEEGLREKTTHLISEIAVEGQLFSLMEEVAFHQLMHHIAAQYAIHQEDHEPCTSPWWSW